MCTICDRAWLGMRNARWGDKHFQSMIRFKGLWILGFNRYHDPSAKKLRRNVGYNYKEDARRFNIQYD